MRIVDDYNHTKHSSTNEVPFEVFFSLIFDLIIEIFTGLSEPGYFNPGYSSNITPFAIPEEELESRRQKAKDYLEISAAKKGFGPKASLKEILERLEYLGGGGDYSKDFREFLL